MTDTRTPAEAMPRHRTDRRHGRSRLLGCLVMASLLLFGAGCSEEEPPTPEQERLERLETRLEETFSGDQADCIIERLDEDLIRILDQRTNLAPEGSDLREWGDALRACVTGVDSADTTTTEAPSTTAEETPEG